MPGEPFFTELGDRSVRLFRYERDEQRQLLVGDARWIPASDRIWGEVAAFALTSKQSRNGCLADVEEFGDLRLRQVALCVSNNDSLTKVQGERNHRADRSDLYDPRKWEPL
ncbi:hypothetical protein AKJ09_02245 [Labilithrix luteola]|uniref:Uncharacterized protein n=1 Tax=Labilithrix luteola TaxID=1391654 RepID=A0A0K1PQA8_9BACT|nr:hypothetical protein AKJ09_02245 [Labilithrix luteola]